MGPSTRSGRGQAFRLTLFGYSATPVQADLESRPRWVRAARAALALVACWALVPIVFLVPPHAEWSIAAFAAGVILARRQWSGAYRVRALAAGCPACGGRIVLAAGELVELPSTLACGACGRRPVLEAGLAADDGPPGRAPARPGVVLHPLDPSRPLRAFRASGTWSPAGSTWSDRD